MSYFTSILLTLAALVLLKHVVTRAFYARVNPAARAEKRKFERAKARSEELAQPDEDPLKATERLSKLLKEADHSHRPGAMMFVGAVGLWAVGLALSWLAAVKLGGPAAEPVWWAGIAYVAAKILISAVVLFRKDETFDRLSPLTVATIALAVGAIVGVGPMLLYSIAPVGVVVFAMAYWLASALLWRIFPPTNDDMPKVAMLFL